MLAALCLLFFTAGASAGPQLSSDPTGFFTNLAARLLSSELNLPLTRLQVYPTNQYTPAVHRLLQLTANLYDATTNRTDLSDYPHLPSVFRPLFRRDTNGAVWIAGYREVTDARMAEAATAPLMVDLENNPGRLAVPLLATPFDADDQNEPMVVGVPLVIGARKGLPNFNKCVLQNEVKVMRRLSFRRNPGEPVSETNQAYTLSISNTLAVQAWNSYMTRYPRDLRMIAEGEAFLVLSNESGYIQGPNNLLLTNTCAFSGVSNIAADAWLGCKPNITYFLSYTFKLPVMTNYWFLTNDSYYRQTGNPATTRFIPATSETFDASNQYRTPQWWLGTRARLRFALVDTSVTPNRIVDYVNLDQEEPTTNIIQVVRSDATCDGNIPGSTGPWPEGNSDQGFLWCTNRLGDPTGSLNLSNINVPTYGIINQIRVALDPRYVDKDLWGVFSSGSPGNTEPREIAAMRFAIRMFGIGDPSDPLNNDFAAPFSPKRTFYQYPIKWEANDPLVHYTVPDLVDQLVFPNKLDLDSDYHSPLRSIASSLPINSRYQPWGWSLYFPEDSDASAQTRLNPAVKDPLVMRSDNWAFPSNAPLSFAMLGRVHRGTPWQTVYLKSESVAPNIWMRWTGDINASSALTTMPTNDWRLVNLLEPFFNTNHPAQRFSINERNTNAWLGILDGLQVLTNSPTLDTVIMTSNSPQAALISSSILAARSAQPGRYFRTVGAILAAPALSTLSPWLNTNADHADYGITDEAYEKIPSQLLSLLRADSIGSLSVSNGRAVLQFSGYDEFPYALAASSNLVDWAEFSTNVPTNGRFRHELPMPTSRGAQFYRSVLLP